MWKTSRCLSSDKNENIPESPLLTAVTQTLQTAEKKNMWSFSERLNECASLFVCLLVSKTGFQTRFLPTGSVLRAADSR